MLRLDIEEWLTAEGVRCVEHKATWARLNISVDGVVVSEICDRGAHSVRTGLYLPLYPLAEWIACQWFPLLFESQVPGKPDERGFWRRHVMRAASEGFALPELSIVSEDREVHLEWKAMDLPANGVRFLGSGEARIGREPLRESLAGFVNSVLSRLDSECPGKKTFLHEEWESVHSLDPEEIDFCERAASLGLDPFSLEEAQQREIITANDAIPAALRADFFRAASPVALQEHLRWLQDGLSGAQSLSGAADALPQLRRHVASCLAGISGTSPWGAGYECARSLRKYLGLNGEPLSGNEYDEKFGYAAARQFPNDQVNFDALTVRDENTQLGSFLLSGKRADSCRFAYARALFEYLTNAQDMSLVSRAITFGQRRNRAFAAELLVPAEALQKRLRKGLISREQIEGLADDFAVSTYIIEHQIENHKLGHVQAISD